MHPALAQAVPAYCTNGSFHLSPGQLAACLKAGWDKPVTTAQNLGAATGRNFVPVLIIGAIIGLLIMLARRRSATPAPGRQ